MLDCRAKLVVIVTDCCANFMQSGVGDQVAVVIKSQQAGGQVSSVLGDLLLRHRGLVDITACRKGAVTWSDTVNGGHFTKALTSACSRAGPYGNSRYLEGFTTWGRFFTTVTMYAMQMPQRVAPYSFSKLN
jgi:hypothetical protein